MIDVIENIDDFKVKSLASGLTSVGRTLELIKCPPVDGWHERQVLIVKCQSEDYTLSLGDYKDNRNQKKLSTSVFHHDVIKSISEKFDLSRRLKRVNGHIRLYSPTYDVVGMSINKIELNPSTEEKILAIYHYATEDWRKGPELFVHGIYKVIFNQDVI